MAAKIPFDELLHTRFQIGTGPIFQALFEHLNGAQQRYPPLIADVVNFIRGVAGGRIGRIRR
jgi:hypothetical protein